jgi:hypothetical protein
MGDDTSNGKMDIFMSNLLLIKEQLFSHVLF